LNGSGNTFSRFILLFRIVDYWREKGKSGYYVWRFRLEKISEKLKEEYILQHDLSISEHPKKEYKSTKRISTTIQRIVRDTDVSREIKRLYDYKCQVCRTTIKTNSGSYIEAAHIKPLGAPHNGPDTLENIICLCPNHHVKFDYGGFAILDDFELVGEDGKLFVHPQHNINLEFVRYHREHFYLDH
jgi:putative restriction endonuclease